MDWLIALAIFLYLACAGLIIAEIFVPSGGLLSICAFACVAGGILIFFNKSGTAGVIGIIIAAVMIPSALAFAYKIFPKTKFGKNVTLTPPQRQQGDAIADSQNLKQLLGAEGTVLTTLRPVGMCEFSGKKIECVAESGYVSKGKKVKVIRVQSTQVTVRVVSDSENEENDYA